MDMVEWNIKTTSDNCPHLSMIFAVGGNSMEVDHIECNHPDVDICMCSSKNCPIIIKESKYVQ